MNQRYMDSIYKINIETLLKAINCAENNIIITDSEGTILWCNDHALIATGYAKEEFIGQNPNILQHDETKLETYKDMWDTIKNKKLTWKGKLKNKKKDGSTYYENLSITPILNENNEIECFIGVQIDITETELLKEKIKNKIQEVQEGIKKHKLIS